MNINKKLLKFSFIFAFIFTLCLGLRSFVLAQSDQTQKIAVLVGFKQKPTLADKVFVQSIGGHVKHSYNIIPALAVNIPEKAIEALQKNPKITVVEPDIKVYAIDAELDNTWGVKKIKAGQVHDTNNKGSGIKVAVIDSGIDHTHPDLDQNYKGGYDFHNDDTDPTDDNGHGTHVAGTIAALDNGIGVVGVAPESDLYAYKVLGSDGSGSYSNVIAALDQAVRDGIQITNNSYGSSADPGILVKEAFDRSADLDIIHIAAAGNSGNPSGRGNNVNYPARWDSVIAVSATDQNDKRISWSSTGPAVEISAPGLAIRSTIPGGAYADYSGTSMASPHVAGTAALVLHAGYQVSQVRQQLTSISIDLGPVGRDIQYGYGRVDALAASSLSPIQDPEPTPTETPSEPVEGNISVNSISYNFFGGADSKKHLNLIISVIDDANNPVANASIAFKLSNETQTWTSTSTTDSTGIATYSLKNAPTGCYSTAIDSVTVGGQTYQNIETPYNYSCSQ